MKLIWKVESCRLHVHQSLVGEDVLQQSQGPHSQVSVLPPQERHTKSLAELSVRAGWMLGKLLVSHLSRTVDAHAHDSRPSDTEVSVLSLLTSAPVSPHPLANILCLCPI